MTEQKFKVGDRVQVVSCNAIEIGAVKQVKNEFTRIVEFSDGSCDALDVEQLAPAPALVVIPDCVAEYIEDLKEKGASLYTAILNLTKEEEDAFEDWATAIDNPYETLARAWLDGYTVEKEPLYYVKMPFSTWDEDSADLETNWAYLQHDVTSDETRMAATNTEFPSNDFKSKLSEGTIKAIDERYWQFAVPVERGAQL
ncbi:DUF1642 domain-containing protein [Listeria booriae]|uniref:DUF1642 domain-containing protein n=1 Tax=Listeria booriae TaxID=1552123 RepID=A0A842D011_9LIST|nr:DUF1642 domain-containing protein [Listeria booriae]MBC2004420.1 DUF1642 domain-containing protein [Listeria booriae]